MPEHHVFLGRQPILGRGCELMAYELLFRSGQENAAVFKDDFAATASVIDSAFLSLGIQRAIGDKTAFINVSADGLMSEMIEVLPRDRVVLEILESVELADAIVERCRALKREGFRFALDDVVGLSPAQIAMLDCISYVKFDIRKIRPPEIPALVAMVHEHRTKAVAEKVETEAEFELCKAAGADYFQGYFFARPTVISGRALQPPKPILIALMRLLASDPDISVLEEMLKAAPDLTIRLLRLANSVSMGSLHKISSLRGAILRIGLVQIRRMVQVTLFARYHAADISSDPLVQAAAIRGRLMENLAVSRGMSGLREEAFVVGILSLADGVFGQTMIDLLQVLDLDETLHQALLLRAGPLGELLALVEASEQTDGADTAALLARMTPAEAMEFNRLQIEAMRWASNL
ncbi:EAL and HDOD domain-containing protein [Acidisoma sp. C75]